MTRLSSTFGMAKLARAALVFGAVVLSTAAQAAAPDARELIEGVWISGQVMPEDLASLKQGGFRSIVDLRPDGEQADQPDSVVVDRAVKAFGISFAYVPVAPGEIAGGQVDALAQSLAIMDKPVLLYCRSGRRAARTWALSEASRAGGLDVADIQRALQSAGQSAPELDVEIISRIAARKNGP